MKVLVVVHGFPPRALGGAEIYADSHARQLAAAGDEVVVLTREADPGRSEYSVRREERDGLRIVWINNTFAAVRSFEESYRNPAIAAIASEVIDRERPDVAHVHHLTCLSTEIVPMLGARHIPVVMTLHDYWLMCHRGQLIDRRGCVCDGPGMDSCGDCIGPAASAAPLAFAGARALRAVADRLPRRLAGALVETGAAAAAATGDGEARAARVRLRHMRDVCASVGHFLAPSRYIRERFIEFGIAPSRITWSPYGIDTASLVNARAAARPSGRLRVGFVGSLMLSKAPHLLLEAAKRLPSGAASFHLFGAITPYHGDASYGPRVEALAAEAGAHLHGPVLHERAADMFAGLDVLVVPSIWPENSPIVIHEALEAGVPVVAAAVGGIPELIEHGRNGLLFRVGDGDELAATLARLTREPDLYEALRAATPRARTIADDVDACRRLYGELRGPAAVSQRTTAVVLNYQTPDETLLAVTSLLAVDPPLAAVVVVNNGPVAAFRPESIQSDRARLRTLATPTNVGFSGGVNLGIRDALEHGADRVLLVNSDVIVPPGCVAKLAHALDADAAAGIAAPVVLSRAEPDRVLSLGIAYTPATGRMRLLGAGRRLNEMTDGAAGPVDAVTGCVMLIDRAVCERVGLFDEEYFFSFEDIDYCLRARAAGFSTVIAHDAFVYHEGSRSIGARAAARLYYAARNHLRLAGRHADSGRAAGVARIGFVVALNVAHAFRTTGGTLVTRLGAVARGTRDFAADRWGEQRMVAADDAVGDALR